MKIIIAAIIGLAAIGVSQAEAAPPQKYDVVLAPPTDTVAECEPGQLFEATVPKQGTAGCLRPDGLVALARSSWPGPVRVSYDPFAAWPLYVSNGP